MELDSTELDGFGAGPSLESGASAPVLRPPGVTDPALLGGPAEGAGQPPAGRRARGFRPDRQTRFEGQVGYQGVFMPSVAPFKRMSALDGVVMLDQAPVLGLVDPVRRPVAVLGRNVPSPDGAPRDRFWAEVVLDFSEGKVVPLPSVAADVRLLELRTEPAIALRVERDGADNLFAVAAGLPPPRVRAIYLLDAPRAYFGSSLPDAPSDTLAGEVFGLPPLVRRQGRLFAAELGLAPGMALSRVLPVLTGYFRAFEEADTPGTDSGQIFLDLARAGKGVCRHRAYAFLITAQALGVPTRFVQNEAHAWVEVKVARRGWMRIDLGGAARAIQPSGGAPTVAYAPPVPDPWPRPPAYVRAYQEAARLNAASSGRLERAQGVRGAGDLRLKPTLAAGQGGGRRGPPDGRMPVRLVLSETPEAVTRGQLFLIEGQALERSGAPAEGLRIEVSLAQPQGELAVLVGIAVSDARGRFEAALAVPHDLPPGNYALVVVTPGDQRRAAARVL